MQSGEDLYAGSLAADVRLSGLTSQLGPSWALGFSLSCTTFLSGKRGITVPIQWVSGTPKPDNERKALVTGPDT